VKTKPYFTLLLLVPVIAALFALPALVVSPGDGNVTSSGGVDELKQDGPGKSWRVDTVLGRDVARLFVQGQGCYLSRTLGPR